VVYVICFLYNYMDGNLNDDGLRVTGYKLRLLIIILVGFCSLSRLVSHQSHKDLSFETPIVKTHLASAEPN
jgi:hypothetical protein